jgi:hypothetical protein
LRGLKDDKTNTKGIEIFYPLHDFSTQGMKKTSLEFSSRDQKIDVLIPGMSNP